VFENWVLRSIFGSKRDRVTWEWNKLHNEELYNVYSSPNFIWVIKPRLAGHVACMEVRRGAYRGDLREGNHLEDADIDGMDLQGVGLGVMDWIDLA
jgi:hypothetical protein